MSKFKNLERVTLKELEQLDMKYEGKNEFTKEDAEKYRILAHAWKCLATAEAMHEAKEMEEENERSFARGYGRKYYPRMSMDQGNGMSGHYPLEGYYPAHSYGYDPYYTRY